MRATLTTLSVAAVATILSWQPALGSGDHEGGHGDFAFGSPAKTAEADRTVEIAASDTMAFNPARIDVAAGEVVHFVINNTGTIQHSFTIGSNKWHAHHEEEMQGMPVDEIAGHMKHEPNGVVVPPGESRELTWKFKGNGSVQFGCHIPGHWPAGMKGDFNMG